MIAFEWDSAKAAANLKKHHVSFEEAKSVFFDLDNPAEKVAPSVKFS